MSDAFVARLAAARRASTTPPRIHALAERFATDVLALLFPPLGAGSPVCNVDDVAEELRHVRGLLRQSLDRLGAHGNAHDEEDHDAQHLRDVEAAFVAGLPDVYSLLLEDAHAIADGDPAARDVDEVIAAYPGFHAIALYRVAHLLQTLDVPLLPRLITEIGHSATGVDIHPGAQIGRAFSIDHGTGLVIGATAVLGDRIRLFQGVTLGALTVAKALAATKRHPTLEDDVVVYANATILGGSTLVGRGSVIGGNVWLTRSVPARSVVTIARERQQQGWDGVEDFSI